MKTTATRSVPWEITQSPTAPWFVLFGPRQCTVSTTQLIFGLWQNSLICLNDFCPFVLSFLFLSAINTFQVRKPFFMWLAGFLIFCKWCVKVVDSLLRGFNVSTDKLKNVVGVSSTFLHLTVVDSDGVKGRRGKSSSVIDAAVVRLSRGSCAMFPLMVLEGTLICSLLVKFAC